MNKKILKCISTGTLAGIMSLVTLTPAFAVVDGYLVKKDGKLFSYNAKELEKNAIKYGAKLPASLYEDFLKGEVVAYHDNVKEYINATYAEKAAIKEGKTFNLDDYTSKAEGKIIYKPESTVIQKKIDGKGNIIEVDEESEEKQQNITFGKPEKGFWDGDFRVNFNEDVEEESAINLENYKIKLTRKSTGKTENVQIAELRKYDNSVAIWTVRHLNLEEGDKIDIAISGIKSKDDSIINNTDITYIVNKDIDGPIIADESYLYVPETLKEITIEFNETFKNDIDEIYKGNKLKSKVKAVYDDGTEAKIKDIGFASAFYGGKMYGESSIYIQFENSLKENITINIEEGALEDKYGNKSKAISIKSDLKEQIADNISYNSDKDKNHLGMINLMNALVNSSLITENQPLYKFESLDNAEKSVVVTKFMKLINEKEIDCEDLDNLNIISILLSEALSAYDENLEKINNSNSIQELTNTMNELKFEGFYNLEDCYKEKIATEILNGKLNDKYDNLNEVGEILKKQLIIIVDEKLAQLPDAEKIELNEKNINEIEEKFKNIDNNIESIQSLEMGLNDINNMFKNYTNKDNLQNKIYESQFDLIISKIEQENFERIAYQDNILDILYGIANPYMGEYNIQIISSDNDVLPIDGILGKSNKDEIVNVKVSLERYGDKKTTDISLNIKAN